MLILMYILLYIVMLTLKIKMSVILPAKWVHLRTAENSNLGQAS